MGRRTCVRSLGVKLAHVQWAATLGGEVKLLAAAGDAPADVRFGLTVVHGDINVVDAGVQDSVEDALGLARRQRPAHAGNHTAQLQGAEAKGGHVQSGTPKYSRGEV